MIDLQATDEFWSVVEECLQAFHHLSPVDAGQKTRELRRKLKLPPPGLPADLASEIIYPEEPFHVAGDLAGRRLDLDQYRSQYDANLSRHNRQGSTGNGGAGAISTFLRTRRPGHSGEKRGAVGGTPAAAPH